MVANQDSTASNPAGSGSVTRAEEMYTPEVFGRTASTVIEVAK